jgi:CRP-like cAMP-binding protein
MCFLFPKRKEGEPSHAMYLVIKGTVAVRKMRGSSYVEIARIYPNEVLGELSFFDRLPRSACAIAMTDVTLLQIKFEALDKVYDKVPDYIKTIMASVAERLRKANETIRRLQKNVVEADVDVKAERSEAETALAAANEAAAAVSGQAIKAVADAAESADAAPTTETVPAADPNKNE